LQAIALPSFVKEFAMPQQTENVTVRIKPEIQKKLGRIASSMDRSRNWVINQAVEQYLDVYDWQARRIMERYQEAEKDGSFIPHDAAMQQIEKKIKEMA
jgi:predicted transcriptional regulator